MIPSVIEVVLYAMRYALCAMPARWQVLNLIWHRASRYLAARIIGLATRG